MGERLGGCRRRLPVDLLTLGEKLRNTNGNSLAKVS